MSLGNRSSPAPHAPDRYLCSGLVEVGVAVDETRVGGEATVAIAATHRFGSPCRANLTNRASSDGGLRCDERNVVLSVRLLVPIGNFVADGDDIVLWRVVAVRTSTSSLVETFEPGNIPAGYRETVPLDMPEKGDEVVIYLDIRGGGSRGIGFD
jgi:hypothetical protein